MTRTDTCATCGVAVAVGRWLCLDDERRLPQEILDALREAARPLERAQAAAVTYLRGLPPLDCAQDGCPRSRAPGRRTCQGHSGTGPKGEPHFGVEGDHA